MRDMKKRASSRREFMQLSGLAVGATGLALPTVAGAAATTTPGTAQPISQRDSGAILAQLVEGNKRFVKGELTHPGAGPRTSRRWQRGRHRLPSSWVVPTRGWPPN